MAKRRTYTLHVIRHYTVEVTTEELIDTGFRDTQQHAKEYAHEYTEGPYLTETILESVEEEVVKKVKPRRGIGSY